MAYSADTNTLPPQDAPLRAYWTAKNINATAGSRTATTRPLEVGMILHEDVYGHDGKEAGATKAPLNLTMIVNAGERIYNAYKVVSFDASVVNSTASGALAGGWVNVVAWDDGRDTTKVNGSISVGTQLITQLHTSSSTGGSLIAATSVSDVATASASTNHVLGHAKQANSSGDAFITTTFNGRRR